SFDGPIVIDIEDVNNGKGRTGQLTQAERTDLAVYFCEEIKSRGYEPMIYGNLKSMMLMLDLSRREDYKKWYAFYDLPIYYPYEYDILQYKDTGKINGIKGDVDFNIGFDLWFD
ncbi:MAG: Lyzozyme M1 (1,4-beta-N-acetylmuramidase), partial [Lachnospiraceae bacterium]|nr:Lyzozyme M1 (1,4-beta-N-acetylmuramidase) [Lachnospiraceae bacterium]